MDDMVHGPVPIVQVHLAPSSSIKSSSTSASGSLSTSWPYFALYKTFTSHSCSSKDSMVHGPVPIVQVHLAPSSSIKSSSTSASGSLSRSRPYFALYKSFTSQSVSSKDSMVQGPVPIVHVHLAPSSSIKSSSTSESGSLSTSWPYFALYRSFSSQSFSSKDAMVHGPVPIVHVHMAP